MIILQKLIICLLLKKDRKLTIQIYNKINKLVFVEFSTIKKSTIHFWSWGLISNPQFQKSDFGVFQN